MQAAVGVAHTLVKPMQINANAKGPMSQLGQSPNMKTAAKVAQSPAKINADAKLQCPNGPEP